MQPTRLAPVLVHSVETVQPGADAKGVRIDLEVQDEAATVAGDADRLQQVFWNLLSNAVKFTPREGRIVVRLVHDNGGCEISVADNGAGVDPKFLPHIFERFRQGDSRYGARARRSWPRAGDCPADCRDARRIDRGRERRGRHGCHIPRGAARDRRGEQLACCRIANPGRSRCLRQQFEPRKEMLS